MILLQEYKGYSTLVILVVQFTSFIKKKKTYDHPSKRKSGT